MTDVVNLDFVGKIRRYLLLLSRQDLSMRCEVVKLWEIPTERENPP